MRPIHQPPIEAELAAFATPRVVVAEDDDALRALIAETLRRRGYEVLEAKDGARLVELVMEYFDTRDPRGVDVVVTDVRMSGASGLAAVEVIRLHDPAIPVIVMTAYPDAQVAQEVERLGARALLAKPFDLRRLVDLVDAYA
jgi:two-component system response regulator HydG